MEPELGEIKPTELPDMEMQPVKVADRKQVAKKPAAWQKYPLLVNLHNGIQDIQAVFSEHNYALFVKQFVVVVGAFLLVRFACSKLDSRRKELADTISAIQIQQTNKEDYLANKEHLLELEPIFPDMAQKNDWLLKRLMDIFKAHNIVVDIDGNVTETVKDDYTILAQTATFQELFPAVGNLIADIESEDDFLRISNLQISKVIAEGALGKNQISITFNTLFPKEKYGPRVFKDYAEQMAKRRGESVEVPAEGLEEEPATETEEEE